MGGSSYQSLLSTQAVFLFVVFHPSQRSLRSRGMRWLRRCLIGHPHVIVAEARGRSPRRLGSGPFCPEDRRLSPKRGPRLVIDHKSIYRTPTAPIKLKAPCLRKVSEMQIEGWALGNCHLGSYHLRCRLFHKDLYWRMACTPSRPGKFTNLMLVGFARGRLPLPNLSKAFHGRQCHHPIHLQQLGNNRMHQLPTHLILPTPTTHTPLIKGVAVHPLN